MNIVKTHQLKIEKALYFRKKLHPQEMNTEMANITDFLKENSINKIWSIVSSTLVAEQTSSGYVMDIEIICPIDSKFQSNEKYQYLEHILIDDALYVRYEGKADFFQAAYTKLSVYMKQNQLTPITEAYCVTIKESTPNDASCILDIYIGMQ